MVAYNHYIDFIPKLKNEKSSPGIFSYIMKVKESPLFDLHERLRYKVKFINNQGRDLSLYSEREFSAKAEEQLWAFEVENVVTFFWYRETKTLHYLPHEKFSTRLLEYWALHIVLPVFFTLEDTYDFLHAGAVEIEGKPVLFVAESFGGKSTMTDFFLKQGHIMISDDKVAIYESAKTFLAVPSHPHHRPHRKMEDLGFFVSNVAVYPKPIHAIYELERAEPDADITIDELHGIEKFKSLRYSSEINLSFKKTKRFIFLSHLAKAVPVYKVTVPWDMERLPEVHEVICRHSINQI